MYDHEQVTKTPELPKGCPKCKGRPFRSVTRQVGEAFEYVSVRCDCPKGRVLAAKDAERKQAAI